MDQERATQVMLQIHNEGSAVCGVYPKDIADFEAQIAHMLRLAAEYRGLDEVAAPPELKKHEDDPQFAAALRQERVLFAERKAAFAAQIAGLNQAKELEEREVEYTQAKQAGLNARAPCSRRSSTTSTAW